MATTRRIPWKLIFAYVLDWILIVGIAAVGGGLSYIPPYKRTFFLADPSISYPYRSSAISTGLLVVLSLLLPIVVIVVFAVAFCPAPAARRNFSRRAFWARKIWEINAGLMGLALSYVLALLLTQMVKNLFGRPRPDLLARCMPDLSRIAAHTVGGDGKDVAMSWVMVDVGICTNTDKSVLDDGFRSFFSGHSSSAWSGLLYLSLWLAAKLNVTLPYVQPYTAHDLEVAANKDHETLPVYQDESENDSQTHSLVNLNPVETYRQSGAAVPIYGLIISILPILLAIYIVSTRYQEFKHSGVDITVGSLVGSGFAILAFRSYHSSLTRGCAWTWAPRPADHAFAVTTSTGAKVGPRRRPGLLTTPADQIARKEVRPSSSNADPEQRLTELEDGHGEGMRDTQYNGRGI
ncbi:PAP2-domain-containing protein [Myriangium duriaei CBS 260.36]|uniref:PAP2-domain-containing protein n=1 Tax=Myriangium duriaei CBS 260.36 TaxID=1168546 RepID=A0A9P4J8V8_9PEZI|nr:PAP2-domain-containing protein [Myriangium duriaei CBS 260.36]